MATIGVGLMELAVVLVVFGSLLLGLFIVCWTVMRLLQGGGRKGGILQADEAKLMQEVYHGLSMMERRIETLETLLLEQERKGNKS